MLRYVTSLVHVEVVLMHGGILTVVCSFSLLTSYRCLIINISICENLPLIPWFPYVSQYAVISVLGDGLRNA